jgi:hypothetical protein
VSIRTFKAVKCVTVHLVATAIMSTSNPSIEDVEKGATDYAHLTNTTVHNFSWEDVTVSVKDRKTKQPLDILSGVDGIVEAGTYAQAPFEWHH